MSTALHLGNKIWVLADAAGLALSDKRSAFLMLVREAIETEEVA